MNEWILQQGTVLNERYRIDNLISIEFLNIVYLGFDEIKRKKVTIQEFFSYDLVDRNIGSTEVRVKENSKRTYDGRLIKFIDAVKTIEKYKDMSALVPIEDVFEANNTVYVVMEYIAGETLEQKLRRDGIIEADKAIEIMVPIFEALKVFHKEGFYHKNISPDDIYITSKNEPKLLFLDPGHFRERFCGRAGGILKLGYDPIEQYMLRLSDGPWTDVYACAATLYKMITGITPIESVERMQNDTVVPPNKIRTEITKSRANAIMNALEVDLKRRTQTIEEFQKELMYNGKVRRKSKLELNNLLCNLRRKKT